MAIFKGKTVEEAIAKGLEQLDVAKERAHVKILQAPSNGIFGFGKKEAQVEIEAIADRVVQQADRAAVRGVPEEITAQAEPVKSAQKVTMELSQVVAKVKKIRDSEKEDGVKNDKIDNTNTTSYSKNLDEQEAIVELSKYLTKITKMLGSPALVRVEHNHNKVYFHLSSENQGMLIGKHGKILNALQHISQIFIHRFTSEKLSIVINVGNYRTKRKEALIRLAKKTAEKVKTTGQTVFLEPMPAFERKQIHFVLMKENNIKIHSEGEDPFRYLVIEYAR
ncbi:MAG: protein jag [Streptococcaceae bacterium]|jgi:spoIIIJ-associated protein|nr:protein jag [Streptococcaceae bacterium]